MKLLQNPLAGPVLMAAVAVVALTSSCTTQNFCAKRTECEAQENDRDLEDDSTRVCAAQFDARINALRANEEQDCQVLADAELALAACQAGLKCDDFFESDLGGECDDEIDDVDDARGDADGLQCTAQD